MSVAHGGQILISDATAELAGGDLSGEASLSDSGVHLLRDLSEPMHVFQVAAPGLPSDFPPLRSLDGYRNNLPADVSSFVGRAGDMDSITEQFESTRLLSLTGAGGAGKTRLAVHAGAELLPRFSDGAWFVDLAGLTEPDLVPLQIATTLHIREKAGRTWIDVPSEYLGDRTLLLVLDNCEQLLEAAADSVDQLLRAAPNLSVLTTTREPLNVPGEVSYLVPALELPAEAGTGTLDDLLGYEAVLLFLDRALEARPEGRDRAGEPRPDPMARSHRGRAGQHESSHAVVARRRRRCPRHDHRRFAASVLVRQRGTRGLALARALPPDRSTAFPCAACPLPLRRGFDRPVAGQRGRGGRSSRRQPEDLRHAVSPDSERAHPTGASTSPLAAASRSYMASSRSSANSSMSGIRSQSPLRPQSMEPV